MPIIVSLLAFVFLSTAKAEFLEPAAFEQNTSPWKALVFLSEACPCSRSHVEHLNQLLKTYPDLKIYGVISEPPQKGEEEKVLNYFKNTPFEFPIIRDDKQALVTHYKALKTPHTTLFVKNSKNEYEIVYEGGVTNQKDFAKSTIHYLQENLQSLSQKLPVKYKNGHSLGCYIRRV